MHEQVEMGGTRSVARGEVVDGEELSALGACQSNALRRLLPDQAVWAFARRTASSRYTEPEARAPNAILLRFSCALRTTHYNGNWERPASQLERLGEADDDPLPRLGSATFRINREHVAAHAV